MFRHLLTLVFLLNAISAQAQSLQFSSYGSIVAGKSLSGDGYWARLPDGAGQYNSELELMTESRVAVQTNYLVSDEFSLVGQLVARGHQQFEPKISWLYSTFTFTAERQIKLGRLRLPVYHFSDVMDVGITYPWIRVPSDAYSLAVTEFDGLMFSQRWGRATGDTRIIVYGGQRDTSPNKLLTVIEQYKNEQQYDQAGTYQGVGDILTTKSYRDMRGMVMENRFDALTLRLSYLKGRENFSYFDMKAQGKALRFGDRWQQTRFLDWSVQWDSERWFFVTEWNYYQHIYKSWFTSLAFRHSAFTPYIYISGFKGSQMQIGDPQTYDDEYQSTGIGLRYDLNARIALKAEFTKFSDFGDAPVFIDLNRDGDTDATMLALSLDFSF